MVVQTLNQLGTLKYGIMQITREFEGVKFIEGNLSKQEELLSLNAFTSSNPNTSVLSITEMNGASIYQQYIGTSEKALVGVLVSPTNDLKDNLAFYKESTELNKHLIKIFSDYEGNGYFQDFGIYKLNSIKDLNGLLFATLTGQPIIALGDEKDVKTLFLTLLSLLPPEIAKKRTLLTHTEKFNPKISFLGMPMTNETMQMMRKYEDTHTIVNLKTNQVFSLYECPLMLKVSVAIHSNDVNAVKIILKELYSNAWAQKENSNFVDISDKLKINKGDAELILKVLQTMEKESSLDFNRIR